MQKLLALAVVIFLFLLGTTDVNAQCAMCKMAAENGSQADGGPVLGLNQGILYLAVVPYLSFSVIAYLFWRGYRRRQQEEKDLQT
jgi:hypothetical protein